MTRPSVKRLRKRRKERERELEVLAVLAEIRRRKLSRIASRKLDWRKYGF